ARGDRVVVTLSSKNLRSKYCVTDLTSVDEESTRDKRRFAQNFVPLVRDDARIDDLVARGQHAVHWNEKYKQMQSIAHQFGRDDFALFQLIGRWCMNIGDILSFAADLNGPRGDDAIQADDFRSVRELLHR